MKSYVLSMNGSGDTSEIFADDDQEAIEQALILLGEDVVVGDKWDADGCNDEGCPCKRLLFWADEDSAELSTVGSA